MESEQVRGRGGGFRGKYTPVCETENGQRKTKKAANEELSALKSRKRVKSPLWNVGFQRWTHSGGMSCLTRSRKKMRGAAVMLEPLAGSRVTVVAKPECFESEKTNR